MTEDYEDDVKGGDIVFGDRPGYRKPYGNEARINDFADTNTSENMFNGSSTINKKVKFSWAK